jgi:hypothetical protein
MEDGGKDLLKKMLAEQEVSLMKGIKDADEGKEVIKKFNKRLTFF